MHIITPDPKDNRFIEWALSANADGWMNACKKDTTSVYNPTTKLEARKGGKKGWASTGEKTAEIVSDFRDERLKKVKPATVYQELSLTRRMFNVARKEWKWIRDNSASDLSFSIGDQDARDRWLTLEEEQALLANATNPAWLTPKVSGQALRFLIHIMACHVLVTFRYLKVWPSVKISFKIN